MISSLQAVCGIMLVNLPGLTGAQISATALVLSFLGITIGLSIGQQTSAILAVRPDLVQRAAMPTDGEGMPLGRLQHLRDLNIDVGVWWYADHPSHYRGDGIPAAAEKGDFWFNARARGLAKAIRAIKEDTETKRLQVEFFGRVHQI